MELKKILCGVDFSEASISAFKAAVQLARIFGADLRVVHVIEPTLAPPDVMPAGDIGREVISVEDKAAMALDSVINDWAAGLQKDKIQTEITTGHATTEIIDRTRDVDLAVIGAKGIRLLEQAVIGGVAEHVVKEAGCSVLLVRD